MCLDYSVGGAAEKIVDDVDRQLAVKKQQAYPQIRL
jgi:hypothetical protein